MLIWFKSCCLYVAMFEIILKFLSYIFVVILWIWGNCWDFSLIMRPQIRVVISGEWCFLLRWNHSTDRFWRYLGMCLGLYALVSFFLRFIEFEKNFLETFAFLRVERTRIWFRNVLKFWKSFRKIANILISIFCRWISPREIYYWSSRTWACLTADTLLGKV